MIVSEELDSFLEYYPTDQRKVDELILYADNESDLYRHKEQIQEMLLKRVKNGSYDHRMAPTAWQHFANNAAKAYAKEFGRNERLAIKFFPTRVRQIAAKEWADRFRSEVKDGEWGDEYKL
jgi:hypothetical protein